MSEEKTIMSEDAESAFKLDDSKALELERKQAHLTNLTREVDLCNKQILEIKTLREMLEEEVLLVKDNYDIANGAFVLLEHKWEYEKDQRFIDNSFKLNRINQRRKMMEYDVARERLKNTQESVEAQLESVSKEKERIEKELGETR